LKKFIVKNPTLIIILVVCSTLMITTAKAQSAEPLLVVFKNDDVADADDVNQNFNSLLSRIESNEGTFDNAFSYQNSTDANQDVAIGGNTSDIQNLQNLPEIVGHSESGNAALLTAIDSLQAMTTNSESGNAALFAAITNVVGDKGDTGDTGADSVVPGPQGTSCTVARGDNQQFATISCGEGTIASVYDGTPATGNAEGDMQYWNGSAWLMISAPTENANSLSFCDGQPTWTQGDCPVLYEVGDVGPAGGWVFHIGNGGLTGLEAAPVDQSTSIKWGCVGDDVSEANHSNVGSGAQNTDAIVSFGCVDGVDGSPAALAATGFELNGYDDWFLPSADELEDMWLNLADSDGDGANSGPTDPNNIGGFSSNFYWSSSQGSADYACFRYFAYDYATCSANKSNALRVRAVRAF
jgi:hypothetical protein